VLAAKPSGGSTSPLEEHADWLLELIERPPDLILEEIAAASKKRRITSSRRAVWCFFERHRITLKKACGPWYASARTLSGLVEGGCESKGFSIRPVWCSLTRRRRTPKWYGLWVAVHKASESLIPPRWALGDDHFSRESAPGWDLGSTRGQRSGGRADLRCLRRTMPCS
jgi:hypothetical protein